MAIFRTVNGVGSGGVGYTFDSDKYTANAYKTKYNDGSTYSTALGNFVGGTNTATFKATGSGVVIVEAYVEGTNPKTYIYNTTPAKCITCKNETNRKVYVYIVSSGTVLSVSTSGTGYSTYRVGVHVCTDSTELQKVTSYYDSFIAKAQFIDGLAELGL